MGFHGAAELDAALHAVLEEIVLLNKENAYTTREVCPAPYQGTHKLTHRPPKTLCSRKCKRNINTQQRIWHISSNCNPVRLALDALFSVQLVKSNYHKPLEKQRDSAKALQPWRYLFRYRKYISHHKEGSYLRAMEHPNTIDAAASGLQPKPNRSPAQRVRFGEEERRNE